MKEITIDCTMIEDPGVLHQTLAEALSFPDWYGHNLDALYDALTSLPTAIHLTFHGFSQLGDFARKLFRVLDDAVQSNPTLQITIIL